MVSCTSLAVGRKSAFLLMHCTSINTQSDADAYASERAKVCKGAVHAALQHVLHTGHAASLAEVRLQILKRSGSWPQLANNSRAMALQCHCSSGLRWMPKSLCRSQTQYTPCWWGRQWPQGSPAVSWAGAYGPAQAPPCSSKRGQSFSVCRCVQSRSTELH